MPLRLPPVSRHLATPLLRAGQELLDLLLPARCQLCNGPASTRLERTLCEACAGDWPRLTPGCPCCGLPGQDSSSLCQACVAEPPVYDRARSLTLYEGKVVEAVQALKYHGRRGLAPLLGRWMLEAMPALFGETRYRAIVPIPLHWRRRVWRGYNQAELLAEPISSALDIPLELELTRGRSTPKQARLGIRERRQNLAEVFTISAGAAKRLAGGDILIVDDVFTTGATSSACAFSLKQAGVERVDVLTLARTP